MNSGYDGIRNRVAGALERAADVHDAGRFHELSKIFAEVDTSETCRDGDKFEKIAIAMNFFDGWVDASNHEWQYYEGISQEDWPRYARIIVTALRTDREIPTPVILQHFRLQGSVRDPSIIRRLLRFFGIMNSKP